MLYCALTGQLMEKSLAAVKKHMAGKRFLRAKERYMKDEIDLRAEMDLSMESAEVSARTSMHQCIGPERAQQ